MVADLFELLRADKDAEQGLIFGESDADYRATGWLGSTAIKDYINSPEGFHRRYVKRDPFWLRKQTKSLSLGSLIDAMAEGTENERFIEVPPEFITASGARSTGKACREWVAEQEDKGLEVVSRQEMEIAELLTDRLKATIIAAEHMTGHTQTTARLVHPSTGVPVQGRADFYQPGQYFSDLKTTSIKELTAKAWQRELVKWGYHIQGGKYQKIFSAFEDGRMMPFYHIVVQTVYPFEVRVFQIIQSALDEGWDAASEALTGISQGVFAVHQEEPGIVGLPSWA